MSIPKLREEEAKITVLRMLFEAHPRGLDSTEIKKEFSKWRNIGDDSRKAKVRDEPIYFSIIQNAIDRMNESSDYFKKSYVEITYHSKPKIIRLTDEGFVFIKKFNQYVSLYDCYEWQVYLFFYSDFLTKYNSSIRKACLPPGIIFENCIKSRKFAMEVDPKNESVNRFVTAAQKIRDDLLEKKGGDAVEVKAINSWIEKRNMCDFIEVF